MWRTPIIRITISILGGNSIVPSNQVACDRISCC